jgi:hypothetical protein
MRFLTYIQEEWVLNATGTHGGLYQGTSDVFCNPTKKELGELLEDVRFIINFKTKKLYVWNWDITHSDMARYLRKEELVPSTQIWSDEFQEYCYAGIGEVENGKIKFTYTSDCIKNFGSCKWLHDGTDDKWTKYYFSKPLIETVKKRYLIKDNPE